VIARRRALAALATALMLAGCASTARLEGDWAVGRLSVRVEAAGERAAQSMVAAFELRGSGERGELRLLSPLGTQLALARWSRGQARLTTADGERGYASLDELALAALGERVPLAALPDWIAGRPWSGAASEPSALGFDQLGWAIDLSRRADGRIAALRATPPAVTVRIQLDPATVPST
jgi:outer membrane lipoprotein LolB